MNLMCQNGCFDRTPILTATSTKAVWVKCSECGKLNIRLKQEVRGNVVRMGKRYTEGEAVVECTGDIPHHLPPMFWAMGAYVMSGLGPLKLTDEDKANLARADYSVDGPCSCGKPAARSQRYESEHERCDICEGPCCEAGTRDVHGEKMKSGGICCVCMDGVLC